jgi:hypothetical protein
MLSDSQLLGDSDSDDIVSQWLQGQLTNETLVEYLNSISDLNTILSLVDYYNNLSLTDIICDYVIDNDKIAFFLKKIYTDSFLPAELQFHIPLLRKYQRSFIDQLPIPSSHRRFYQLLFDKGHVIMGNLESIEWYPESIIPNIKHVVDLRNTTYKFDRLINTCLRNNLVDSRTLTIIYNVIDDIRSAAEIKPMVLYRGLKHFDPVIGHIYDDFGFMSKTADIQVATDFASSDDDNSKGVNNSCILMFITHNEQLDMRDVSYYDLEHEHITYPNESFIINNYYNLYYGRRNKIIKVYHCSNIGSFHFPKPNINVKVDNILNNLSITVNGLIHNLKSDQYIIVSANFARCVVPRLYMLERKDYVITLHSDIVQYDEEQGQLIIKHRDITSSYHKFIMKTLQLLVGLSIPYNLMVVDISQIDKDADYTITYMRDDQQVTDVYNYEMCPYAISHDINARIYAHIHNQKIPIFLKHVNSYSYELTYT